MKIMYTFLLFLVVIYTEAQNDPTIEWQNTIGGENADYLSSVSPTSDGGYIVGGYSISDISGDKTENTIGSNGREDFWILKLNSLGVIEWQKTIGENGIDILKSLAQTSDNGYILGGYSYPDTSGNITSDYWVIKLDSSGNIEWENKIGGNNEDILNVIKQTSDGGYIVGGYSFSDQSGDKTSNTIGDDGYEDFWVIKLSATGSIEWQNTIGGNFHDQLNDLIQTSDSNYVLVGWSQSNASGNKTENAIGTGQREDFWVVKLSSTGAIIWENTIGGDDVDAAMSVVESFDGGYVVGGSSRSGISGDKIENRQGSLTYDDYWILKLSSEGNIEWQNTIGGSLNDRLSSVCNVIDGGFIIGGDSTSDANGDKTENTLARDYWIVKIDSLGNVEWDNTIGGNGADALTSLAAKSDDSYILGGFTPSNQSRDKEENSLGSLDYWVVKLKEPTLSVQENDFKSHLVVYPNPTQGTVTMELNKNYSDIDLKVCNLLGQTILEKNFRETNTINFNIDAAQGVYMLYIRAKTGESAFFKLIKTTF